MPVRESPTDDALIAMIAFTVLALGATLVVWLGLGIGVAQDIVSRYTPWVLPGESLLILTTTSDRLEEVRAVLGQREYQQGSVFIMQPEAVVSKPVSHPIRQGRLPEEQLTRHAQELASDHVSVPGLENLRPVEHWVTDAARTIDAVTSRLMESAQAHKASRRPPSGCSTTTT